MSNELPIKNQNYIVNITGQGHEGQGVGRIDGFTVFVEGALLGEQVQIKMVKVASNHGFGKLLKVIKSSTRRARPFCDIHSRCGGCQLQHMTYNAQIEFKTSVVKEALSRIGGMEEVVVKDCIEMESPLHYRNKAQYPVGAVEGQTVIGFFSSRSHEIISGPQCNIQHQESMKVAGIIKEFINEKRISVYNEESGSGIIRHIVTRVGFETGEIMAIVVINADDMPYRKDFIQYVREKSPETTSIVININKKKTNIIFGLKNILLYGNEYIFDLIGDLKFKISPLSFFQVNPVQTKVLYDKVLEYANLTGNETVFDLYCGIGTISLFLSQKVKKVYGIESVESAIKDATENAKLNQVSNAEFICGEAEKVVPELCSRGVKADVVVLDPPRKGCERCLLETVASMNPQRIVYVSCNPATLARDLKILGELGYQVKEVQPVDMFPHTYHVESVCLLSR